MYPWLAQAVEAGTTIVTASRRLALELRKSYDDVQIQSGLETWCTPDIHAWQDWVNSLIDDASPFHAWPTRIDMHSCAILWERCLAKHSEQPVLSFASVVRQARQSWQRLQDWQVPLESVSRAAVSADHKLFAKAAWAYQETLRNNNWIDSAQLPGLIADSLRDGNLQAPASLLLAGFERIPPFTRRVIDAMKDQGCEVRLQSSASRNASITCESFLDRQQELRAAGHWARQFLTVDPTASLAIVCPDLEVDADSTARLVREGLAPGWQYANSASRNAVDVSYGRRLADYPAIAIALLALRWIGGTLDTREVSVLLRSPIIVSSRLAGRSRLELDLRRWPDREWPASSLAAIQRTGAEDAGTEDWLRFLNRLTALHAEHRGPAEPSRWAEVFDRFLADNGWPGEDSQDSESYQLVERWRLLLAEFSATGHVTQRVSLVAAVDRLQSMASELIFQPQSQSGIVHLVGMLETSGICYDGVWIAGLDATRWPSTPNPLYLVSRQLQEDYGMPDATPRDNLEYCAAMLQRVVGSAETVVTSWSIMEGEAELAASPLLEKLAVAPGSVHVDPGWHAASLSRPDSCILLSEDNAPPLQPDELVTGGAATIQAQTFDPFSAFARGRLGIRDIPRIDSGLTAAMKGSISHKVLYALFSDLPDRAAIDGWSADEVASRIDRASAGVFASASRLLSPLDRALLELERHRLKEILVDFIHAERGRPPFAVEYVEQQFGLQKHGVSLQLRIDRIDRLDDGSLLILDYKTGQGRSLLTRDGELQDLQLAVYAAAVVSSQPVPIGGIALINVDSRSISYKGTGGSVDWDPKRKDNWDERLSRWLGLVDTAMMELASGDARVNLRQPAANARPLALLSRITEVEDAS